MTAEFRVKVVVKNNRLWKAVRDTGKTRAEVAREAGVNLGLLYQLLAMAASPVSKRGAWTGRAERLAAYLGETPEYLWPECVVLVSGAVRPAEREVDADEMAEFLGPAAGLRELPAPDAELERRDLEVALRTAVGALKPRDAATVRLHFGLDGGQPMPVSEMLRELGRSQSAINLRLSRSLKQLRHNPQLRAAAGEEGEGT